MWMIAHDYGQDSRGDLSGVLASCVPASVSLKLPWKPVVSLATCSASALIELGCGAARHWQHSLGADGSASYVFEASLRNLQELASWADKLPSSFHVVPCGWRDGLTVSDIVGRHRSAVVVSNGTSSELPYGECKEVHYVQPAGDKLEAGLFMKAISCTRWSVRATCAERETASVHAYRMLQAM